MAGTQGSAAEHPPMAGKGPQEGAAVVAEAAAAVGAAVVVDVAAAVETVAEAMVAINGKGMHFSGGMCVHGRLKRR